MKIFLVLLVFAWRVAYTQPEVIPGKKIKTLTLTDTIIASAIDRPGDFYVVTASGQLQRFDKNGKLLLLHKADQAPTLFDPRDGARLFIYYRGGQQYEFLNPSFEPLSSYRVDSSFAIQPWLICPSGEYKLWVLDKADHSLKKINVRASVVEVEVVVVDPASAGYTTAFTTMREYQNFVFLLDPSTGIHIFNALGKHLRTIPAEGIDTFNFLGEELYYLSNDKLEFFNLFTAETRHLDVPPGYTHALLTDERMILLTPHTIEIFVFRP